MDVLLPAAENKTTLQEHNILKDEFQSLYGSYHQLYRTYYTKRWMWNYKLIFRLSLLLMSLTRTKNNLKITLDWHWSSSLPFVHFLCQVIQIQFPSNRKREVMTLNFKNQLFCNNYEVESWFLLLRLGF